MHNEVWGCAEILLNDVEVLDYGSWLKRDVEFVSLPRSTSHNNIKQCWIMLNPFCPGQNGNYKIK